MAHLYALGHLPRADAVAIGNGSPRSASMTQPPAIASRVPSDDPVAAIVQREINAFILESFGKIIKPKIVETVRRELDPGFTEERLDQHSRGFTGSAAGEFTPAETHRRSHPPANAG